MIETIQDRVKIFISTEKISTRKFESICGISNGAVSKMGDNTRRGIIDKILTAYPQLSRDWLLYGTGPMLRGEAVDGRHADTPEPEDPNGPHALTDTSTTHRLTILEERIRGLEEKITDQAEIIRGLKQIINEKEQRIRLLARLLDIARDCDHEAEQA